MTDTSRILDLQYGSFSCRLEGFDDPVAVLQQVVRYLYDLDGLARGGAPADLAALARFAAPDAQQPVQAELTDGKLALRLAPELAPEPEAEWEPEPEPEIAQEPLDAPAVAAPAWRDSDADMGRMMSQVDAQFNAPEIRAKRDNLAQLKAAVAATEAARQLGEQTPNARHAHAPYRADLGAMRGAIDPAVTRSRPEPPSAPSETATRLNQIIARIDQTGAARPDFVSFLAQSDAVSLDDAIEAAAAYLTTFQQQAYFSRPQAMTLVQGAAPGPIPREDSLRAFGRLLRQNRIIKKDDGSFEVAGDNRFAPVARRMMAG
jgi:hypothetical protein